MNKEALGLIDFMIKEEESDLDCANIHTGKDYDDSTDDDYSWKRKRIKILKYIEKCIQSKGSLIEDKEEKENER